jgi:hypothetical protein
VYVLVVAIGFFRTVSESNKRVGNE